MFKQLIIIPLICASAIAGEVRLSLDRSAEFALRHNPAFQAARLRIEEARGRLKQSGRLSNPELDVQFRRNTAQPEGVLEIELLQRFPLTNRLRLERAISMSELRAAEAEVLDAERKLIADVQATTLRLLAIEGQRELRREQLVNSRELGGFTRRRVESGESSNIDASQVDLETGQLQSDLLQLDVDYTTLLGELRALLGVSTTDRIVITGRLPALTTIPASGVDPSLRPDFIAASASVEAARHASALAKSQRWEDVGFGFAAEGQRMEDAPIGFEQNSFVGVKLAVPLPVWNRNEGRILETSATALRREKERVALATSISAEATAAREAMIALAGVVNTLDKTVLPNAREIEKGLREIYSTGQTSLPEMLRARDRRLSLERQRLEALRDFHLARVRHAAATGKTHSLIRGHFPK